MTERKGTEMQIAPEIRAKMDAAKAKAAALPARLEAMHAKQYDACTAWGETWTEKNVPVMGGGRGTVTYTGCRAHFVAWSHIDADEA